MQNLQFYKVRKKQLKLTNLLIAEKSGLPRRTVEDFFSGSTTNPRIDTVLAINKVLGIKSDADWTDEDTVAGVGNHSTFLSAAEWEWLELRSEIIEARGEEYLNTLIELIKTLSKK